LTRVPPPSSSSSEAFHPSPLFTASFPFFLIPFTPFLRRDPSFFPPKFHGSRRFHHLSESISVTFFFSQKLLLFLLASTFFDGPSFSADPPFYIGYFAKKTAPPPTIQSPSRPPFLQPLLIIDGILPLFHFLTTHGGQDQSELFSPFDSLHGLPNFPFLQQPVPPRDYRKFLSSV